MSTTRAGVRASIVICGAILVTGMLVRHYIPSAAAQAAPILAGPSSSSPIAVTPDGKYVWAVNTDSNSVSMISIENDANQKVAEVGVLEEPSNLAISPDGRSVYVADTASGHVTFIDANPANPAVTANIGVGTEPYGLALTPSGRRLYVTNARSNSISVLDTATFRVLFTIENVGNEPRGIAITNNGDSNDDDELIYVTQFLAIDRPGVLIGRDDYKEGRVTVISVADNRVVSEIALNPMADTGFLANGSALNRIAATDPATFTVPTGAFPNMLNSVAIKNNRAYVPSNAASPDGPVRFNVNIQPMLSVIDLAANKEAEVNGRRQTINMNRGINFEPAGPNRVFLAVPWAIAFKQTANEGYVVSTSSNLVVKVSLDDNGTPTINAPLNAGDPGKIVRIPVGQAPRGIALNSREDRAYVINEVSRDVSVIDLTTNQVTATVRSSDLPAAGSPEATVLLGKAVFTSSTGVNLPQLGSVGVVGARLSSEGWSSCFACHPFGLTDAVVWVFASGPRRTLPLNGSFAPKNPADIKVLNHSAIFDEVQDFELNIRNVSGGLGLITAADGSPAANVTPFTPPNAGRSPHLDALAQYIAVGIRTPNSPLAKVDPASPEGQEIDYGRRMFDQAGCASCHGGPGWSSSRRGSLVLPPAAAEISNTQLIRFLKKVGTFDAAARNEIRATGAAPLGADGFNPPSLLSAFALGPYLHNGTALTFDNVLENVTHRSAGTAGTDTLTDSRDRAALVTFLKSIDGATPPFPIR